MEYKVVERVELDDEDTESAVNTNVVNRTETVGQLVLGFNQSVTVPDLKSARRHRLL